MHHQSTRLHDFEYRIFRTLCAYAELRGAKILVACSGGLDSVALAFCLMKISDRLGFSVELATVHHGDSSREDLRKFREQALLSVQNLAETYALKLHMIRRDLQEPELKAEAELRKFRLLNLKALLAEENLSHLAFAHHADDLFETRMIRLIRGTGPQGLKAMHALKAGILRPFLLESRAAIHRYALDRGLQWVEDPSNESSGPLRNWLRNRWLPELEAKRPGSRDSMARSLEILSVLHHEKTQDLKQSSRGFKIEREAFLRLGEEEKRDQVAGLLLELGARDFTSQHVSEIVKRIGAKRMCDFHMLEFDWRINAQQISVKQAAQNQDGT